MKILLLAKLFSNDKGYRLFGITAEKEWTNRESGEVSKNVTVYFLSFTHPSKKLDAAAVESLFHALSDMPRGVWQDIRKGERTMMGAKECYLDAEQVEKLLK